jgi:NifU-like protein involved in Fe-S cluster formation
VSEHPVCGDLLEVDCRIDEGLIQDFAWRARGCPATVAVAAAARGALLGRPVSEADERMRRRLAELGGLDNAEGHALSLFLRALRNALAEASS